MSTCLKTSYMSMVWTSVIFLLFRIVQLRPHMNRYHCRPGLISVILKQSFHTGVAYFKNPYINPQVMPQPDCKLSWNYTPNSKFPMICCSSSHPAHVLHSTLKTKMDPAYLKARPINIPICLNELINPSICDAYRQQSCVQHQGRFGSKNSESPYREWRR